MSTAKRNPALAWTPLCVFQQIEWHIICWSGTRDDGMGGSAGFTGFFQMQPRRRTNLSWPRLSSKLYRMWIPGLSRFQDTATSCSVLTDNYISEAIDSDPHQAVLSLVSG